MKRLIKAVSALVLTIIILATFASCGDTLHYAPASQIANLSRGDQVVVNENYVSLEKKFEPKAPKDGYIESVYFEINIVGYNADFSYFDSSVEVIWTYNVITDEAPLGKDETFSTTLELTASGNASFSERIKLDGCRSIELVSITYDWAGTATKL